MTGRAHETDNAVKGRRILVAGELNADLIMSGLPSLPVLGRELISTGFSMALGSSSAITAARLAALGAEDPTVRVDFVGLVGRDDIGQFVVDQLRHFGVHTDLIQHVDLPTGITIALTFAHDRALLTYPGTIVAFDGMPLTETLLAGYRHLHVGSYFLQTALQPHLASVFEKARRQGLTTSLDVGWDPSESWMQNPYLADVLLQTDIFMPNETEAAALAPDMDHLRQLVPGTVIVKRGKHGAVAYERGAHPVQLPAYSVTAADTTGAGDAFNAGFLFAYCIRGESCVTALELAIGCGSQATLHFGGATGAPTEAEIREWMTQWRRHE